MSGFVVWVSVVSIPVIVFVAVPLVMLVASWLRGVDGMGRHLAAFAGLGAVLGAVVPLLFLLLMWSMIPAAALAAALGRLAAGQLYRAPH